MLFDVILFILSIFSAAFVGLLKIIPFVTPTYWQTAIEQFIGYGGYFQGWLPIYADATKSGFWAVTGIYPILGVFIGAYVAIYIVKGAVSLFHLFSFGQINLHLPSFGKGRVINK